MDPALVLRRVNRKRSPAPYDETDVGGPESSLYPDQMRAIADLCDLLGAWEHRWEGGDQGLALGIDRLEVYSGETGGINVPDARGNRVERVDHLVGWVTQWDAGHWEFVPCVPQLHWSLDRSRWVGRDEAVAENVRRRREREAEAKAAKAAEEAAS